MKQESTWSQGKLINGGLKYVSEKAPKEGETGDIKIKITVMKYSHAGTQQNVGHTAQSPSNSLW